MAALTDIASLGKIIPVITLERAEDAVPLADALAAGGITTMEITLRTDAGLKAIAHVARERPAIKVGAGTVTSVNALNAAVDVGAQFLVSPGITAALLEAGRKTALPYLPGVSTTSEVMQAREAGFTFLKFFPAEQAGGTPMLKNFGALFSDIMFCPTGGITPVNMESYLALSNVACVGGSWLTPADKLKAQDWRAITALAKAVS